MMEFPRNGCSTFGSNTPSPEEFGAQQDVKATSNRSNNIDSELPSKSRKLSCCSCLDIYEQGQDCRCGCGMDNVEKRKFACPYYRRDPSRKPSSTSCAYPGFPTIFRVKEHLYRKHKATDAKCSRCLETYPSEDALEVHQRSLEACQLRNQAQPQGFTKEQEKRLRSRKRSSTHISDEEKWYEVYRILFPEETKMPNPYIDDGVNHSVEEISRYLDFSRKKMPQELMKELDRSLAGMDTSLGKAWKSGLVDTVLKCQDHIFQLFWKNQEPSRNNRLNEEAAHLDLENYDRSESDCHILSPRSEDILPMPVSLDDFDGVGDFSDLPRSPTAEKLSDPELGISGEILELSELHENAAIANSSEEPLPNWISEIAPRHSGQISEEPLDANGPEQNFGSGWIFCPSQFVPHQSIPDFPKSPREEWFGSGFGDGFTFENQTAAIQYVEDPWVRLEPCASDQTSENLGFQWICGNPFDTG